MPLTNWFPLVFFLFFLPLSFSLSLSFLYVLCFGPPLSITSSTLLLGVSLLPHTVFASHTHTHAHAPTLCTSLHDSRPRRARIRTNQPTNQPTHQKGHHAEESSSESEKEEHGSVSFGAVRRGAAADPSKVRCYRRQERSVGFLKSKTSRKQKKRSLLCFFFVFFSVWRAVHRPVTDWTYNLSPDVLYQPKLRLLFARACFSFVCHLTC